MSIKIGDKLPTFALNNDQNKLVTEKDLTSNFTVIYFYPKDDTSGCTKESIEFNDNLMQFKQLNTEIIGISKDSVESHQNFKQKYNFQFSLLSDPDLILHKQLGAYGEKVSFGKTSVGTIRSTFIIDKNLNIVKVYPKVTVNGHVEQVLNKIKSLS
ncbi:peroxiredoxin [Rickettsiales bacterium LUAb2]